MTQSNGSGKGVATSRLDGKVALVTGGSRGLGKATALELASRGANVAVNYLNSVDSANATVKEIEAFGVKGLAVQGDVSKVASINSIFQEVKKRFGRLDIVFSNSGIESFGHVSEVTEEEFDKVYATNTRGQFFVAKAAYEHLEDYGRLILMSSISAQAKGVPNHAIYQSSKCAVEAMVRAMAVDFGKKKITVNGVAPGGIKTDMYAHAVRRYIKGSDKMTDDEVEAVSASWSPLNRVGMPNDIGRVVAFLASQDGEWMNGQILTIGGGAPL